VPFDLEQLLRVHLPRAELADSLECANDGEIFPCVVAGPSSTPIDKHRGDIQSRDRDHAAWHILIAATNHEHAIHALRAANNLDRIGNHFAGNEGILHSFSAHRNSVADGDGSEELRHRIGGPEHFCGADCKFIQSSVTGSDRAVAVRDPDDWLVEIGIAKADSAQHSAVGSALNTLRNHFASDILAHGDLCVMPKLVNRRSSATQQD
jgi:hypothetical protein